MLWVDGHYKYVHSYSAGIGFIDQASMGWGVTWKGNNCHWYFPNVDQVNMVFIILFLAISVHVVW